VQSVAPELSCSLLRRLTDFLFVGTWIHKLPLKSQSPLIGFGLAERGYVLVRKFRLLRSSHSVIENFLPHDFAFFRSANSKSHCNIAGLARRGETELSQAS
jgi:hypothetical protein